MESRMNIELVPTTTAAFIADLSDRKMQRVIDESIIEAPLVGREGGRSFARFSAALANFYFASDDVFTRKTRLQVIASIVKRIHARKDAEELFSLKGALNEIDWVVLLPAATQVELGDFVKAAQGRVKLISRAEASIVETPEIMGGQPVFRGTRVPAAIVAASKEAGYDFDQLHDAYPFLTPELVEDAQTYLKIHPRMGRPVKAETLADTVKIISSKRVPLKRQVA
jgi:uncharacterized protein (DUF433 family)